MNGWVRIGIVFTVLWIVFVLSYATYEYMTFPLPAGGYYGKDQYYEDEANKRWFLSISSQLVPETTSAEREELSEKIRRSDNDEERQRLVEERDLTESWVSFNPTFYVALLAVVVAFWLLAYGSVLTAKWVRRGFQPGK